MQQVDGVGLAIGKQPEENRVMGTLLLTLLLMISNENQHFPEGITKSCLQTHHIHPRWSIVLKKRQSDRLNFVQ